MVMRVPEIVSPRSVRIIVGFCWLAIVIAVICLLAFFEAISIITRFSLASLASQNHSPAIAGADRARDQKPGFCQYFRLPAEIFKETRFLNWHLHAPRSRVASADGVVSGVLK